MVGIAQPRQEAGIADPANQSHGDAPHPLQNADQVEEQPQEDAQHNDSEGNGNWRYHCREERLAKKAAVRIALLNVNGFGTLTRGSPDNKWNQIYRTIKQRKIGILLQEAHLMEERVRALHKMDGKKMRIFFSPHPTQPMQKEGVAVVVNPCQVNISNITTNEIIPGRAIQVGLQHHDRRTTQILCVYAPTSSGDEERRLFFHELREFYEMRRNFPKPGLIAGDFNNVEEAVDRLPAHRPADPSITALDELKGTLRLMAADGWRLMNPAKLDYTFHRGTGPDATHSRLDRMYTTEEVYAHAREWRIECTGIKTDHDMVRVDIWNQQALEVGRGRPVFPLQLLQTKALTKQMKRRGCEAIAELQLLKESGERTEDRNPQTILNKLKKDWMTMARDLER